MNTNKEWMSIADMMAGLMMVFLFIAIAFMLKIQEEKKSLEEIAFNYERTYLALNEALHDEFDKDLEKWDAIILNDNTIRFKEPDVLFAQNSSVIKEKFKLILNDFFPRYVNILASNQFKESINELRIEGHTSSLWRSDVNQDTSYINNAHLSQERSFSVLSYVYMLDTISKNRPWLTKVIRANGLSFANRLMKTNGDEDYERSRRVEFRVITKSELQIEKIINHAKGIL